MVGGKESRSSDEDRRRRLRDGRRSDRRPEARPILWEQLRLPRLLRRARPDLVFSPAYSLPPAGGAGVVTVHDLSFEILADQFSRKERWRRRFLARRAVGRARRVLTDSEHIARDLMRLYKVAYEKIGVVPLGIDSRFLARAESDGDSPAETPGPDKPYVLYLGSILERRRVDLVIETFSEIAREYPELELVLAGRNRLRRSADLDRWIDASGVRDRIRVVGYVREEDLVYIYRRAALTYYLSTYEGYGLPPLESLAVGTPAVVSRGLALDRLWPDYPFRALTLDLATLTRITRAVLEDSDASQNTAAEGVARMAELGWQRSAEMFLAEIHHP